MCGGDVFGIIARSNNGSKNKRCELTFTKVSIKQSKFTDFFAAGGFQ